MHRKEQYMQSISEKIVVAEWLRAPNSNSDVSVQQSVGSSPSHNTCVLRHLTIASSFGWDVKNG